MNKLNKGEWAEFYVMLKLLSEGKLHTANALLKKNINNYLDIIKVIREETENNIIHYIIDKDTIQIKQKDSDMVMAEIDKSLFDKYATELFNSISKQKGSSVAAPESVYDFAKVIYVDKPKAPSVKSLEKQFGGKNDIFIEVRDPQTSIISIMGFSIKSQFADPPTLFNAGTTSQFLFEINPCNDVIMNKFNGFMNEKGHRDWAECKRYITDNNLSIRYAKPMYKIYDDNLSLITESMSDVVAWCFSDVLLNTGHDKRLKETIERMIAINPLKKSNPNLFYQKWIKDFLMAGFTGMTAGIAWDGKEQVNGGYIVVMDKGEVLCYHSNDRESFRNYLLNNLFIEQVSTKKYKWSYIFKEDGKYYLPLNASLRFSKETR